MRVAPHPKGGCRLSSLSLPCRIGGAGPAMPDVVIMQMARAASNRRKRGRQWLERRRERWDMTYHVVTHDQLEAFAPVVARLAGT